MRALRAVIFDGLPVHALFFVYKGSSWFFLQCTCFVLVVAKKNFVSS